MRVAACMGVMAICMVAIGLGLDGQPKPAAGPREAAAMEVGKPAPPIALKQMLQAPVGAATTLDGLRGKAVMLEFWGTWCAPCVAAFPHLNELVEQTKGEPVVFIAVTDEPESKVAPFLEKKPLRTWVGLDASSATTLAYRVKAFPTTVLIDAQGVVRAITHPAAVDAPMLKRLARGEPIAPPVGEAQAAAPPPSSKAGVIDPAASYYFVWIGPPTPGLGNPTTRAKFMRSPSAVVGDVLETLYNTTPQRIFFEEGVPAKLEIGYEVRLPESSERKASEVLLSTLEQTLRVEARREQRELDALILTRVGEGGPKAANPANPQSWMGDNRSTQVENSRIDVMTNWLERGLARPVVDETGLKALYDWELRAMDGSLEAYNTALGKIGLTLVPGRRTVEVVVVSPVGEGR